MASTSEIRRRIGSVRQTQKITHAMYLISQAKLRKAKQELDNTRPYFQALQAEIGRVFNADSTVESRYLEGLETGDSLTVTLGGEVSLELEMTVTRVNREQELGLLVLASQDKLSSISALRRLNADLIFHTYSGLRVPREAVCYSEESGSAGVYVLVGTKAVWKDIELLYDNGDTYIAALNQSSTDYLWPEDLILLDTEGLFDGKLVD